ncbi:HVO_2922 family protein [Halobaculum sp. EA56]|uniref:HVO_2922 family protein n=1 Tax=Halobaculum sp. EA56 TaxID=3421648 RepID=UPI003EB78E25
MSEHTVFSMDERMERATAAALLRGIAADLAAGDDLRLGEGDDAASVPLPDSMDVEVDLEVDGEDDGTELEVELEWEERDVTAAERAGTDEGDEAGGGDAEPTDAPESTDDGEALGIAATDPEDLPAKAVPAPGAAPPTSLARFELYRDRADEWRWRLVHRNGNIVATSGEGYSSDRAARRGMRSVMRNAPDAAVLREE